jgi:hypothetical protein
MTIAKTVWASTYIFHLRVRDSRKISCTTEFHPQISNMDTTFVKEKKIV